MIESEILLGLPHYEITSVTRDGGHLSIWARYTGPICCPDCGSTELRNKGWSRRSVRHEDFGLRRVVLELCVRRAHCLSCGRYFRQALPGILPRQRASEAFQKAICQDHLDGINRSRLGRRKGIGAATVQRYFLRQLQRQFGKGHPPECPQVLGIDEHFFTRKQGYATTFCDLKNHRIYDVVLGRSQAALESYLRKLKGRDRVRIVCMDLATVYRSIARTFFPNAEIVADRFHVVRLVNQHFLACWRDIDPAGARNRGLLSLMRRHHHNLSPEQKGKLARYFSDKPVLAPVYAFKQRLCHLLGYKHRTAKQCRRLVPKFLRAATQLRQSGLAQLVTLGDTLLSWSEEIVRMWRYTRNNGITEGFHNKMELISRQAYGFRNFDNYRHRVAVLCS